MPIDERLITKEILDNTLKQEIYPEIKFLCEPKKGKVRSVYDIGKNKLIMISSDNLSTHDVVHKRQVYAKGDNLDAISSYYFDLTKNIIPNHFVETLAPSVWLVKKSQPILVEMVFRKYITGSGWKAYDESDGQMMGTNFCGVSLRPGYRKNEMLDDVIFTPTGKGQVKDFNIPEFARMDPNEDDPKITLDIIRKNHVAFGLRNPEDIDYLSDIAKKLYLAIHNDLESKGHLLADTKWEFGYLPDGKIVLIDECVTPDSSRFWDKSKYQFNPEKNEFTIIQDDKQHFRDYVEKLGLHKADKKQELANHWMNDEVLRQGIIKYCNIREKITGTQPLITGIPKRAIILDTLHGQGYLRYTNI